MRMFNMLTDVILDGWCRASHCQVLLRRGLEGTDLAFASYTSVRGRGPPLLIHSLFFVDSRTRRGVGAPHQHPLDLVASCLIYADVWLPIPVMHHIPKGT